MEPIVGAARHRLLMKTRQTLIQPYLLSVVLLGLLFEGSARAADGSPVWTNNFSTALSPSGQPVVDAGGNIYVTGSAANNAGNSDYATIKFSSAGIPVWTNFFNGASNGYDYATALAVDGSGNVYVTGGADGGTSSFDYATIKYSSAGVPLWTNLFNSVGNGSDYGMALAVDGSGNVYVSGSSSTNSSIYDYVTIKYSGSGIPVWTNRVYATYRGDELAVTVAADNSGNAYVTGGKYGYVTIKYSGGNEPPVIVSQLLTDGKVRLSSVGTTGTNYALDRTFNLSHPINWVPQLTNPAGPGGVLLFTNLPIATTNNFWRVRSVP